MPAQKTYNADTYNAGADLSGLQYRAVRWYSTWDNRVRVLGDTGQMIAGVVQNKPSAATGAAVQIISRGTAKAETIGKFSAGDWAIANQTTGKVHNALVTGGSDTGEYLVGYALEAAETGDIMLLNVEIEEVTTDVSP